VDGSPNKAILRLELAIDLAFSIGQREADLLLKLQIGQYAEIPHYKMDPEVYEQLAEATDAFDQRRVVAGIRIRQGKGKVWIEVPIVGATRARVEAQIAAAKAAGVTSLLFDAHRPAVDQPNLEAGQRRFIRRFAELRDVAIESRGHRAPMTMPGPALEPCSSATSAAPPSCSWASSASPTS
jgi:hypothetical protein